MNVGCDRHFQVAPDEGKNLASISHANSAKGPHRSPVRLVVGSFKNKIDIFRRADFRYPFCHAPDKFLRLNHARPENKRWAFPTDSDRPDFERLRFSHELIVGRLCQPPIIFEGVSQKRPTIFAPHKIDNCKRRIQAQEKQQRHSVHLQQVKRTRIREKTQNGKRFRLVQQKSVVKTR